MIKSFRTFEPGQQERVMTALYREDLANRRDSQAAVLTPRSAESWGAEQQRLGSWHSGLGAYRPSGVGEMYRVGQGNYTPVGVANYTEVGRSADVVQHQRDIAMSTTADEARAKWRAEK